MAEELSLQNVDDNCMFIGSSLLEQSENLDDWLSKNGHFLISNDSISDSFINHRLDPLLAETNGKLSDDEDSVQLKNASCKNTPSKKSKSQSITDKTNDVKLRIDNGLHLGFSFIENKVLVKFYDGDDREVMQECIGSISELNGPILKQKDRQLVVEFSKIRICDGINLCMPCLLSEMGVRVYLCPQSTCNHVFGRITTAKLHVLVHINYKPYQCDYPNCSWAFYTPFKLKRHQLTHEKKKDFVCPAEGCLRKFTTIYNLNNHKRLHDRPAILPCPVKLCKEKFQNARDRERHLKSHDRSEAPLRCPFQNCNRSFFMSTALTAHSKTHEHKESDLRCMWPNCGKIFEHPCRLKEHSRLHTGQRPYSCTYEDCKWTFSTASKLRRHQIIHTNERKFHCTIGNCAKSFLRSEHLKEHTLTHIGQRNYQCEVCAATFMGKSALYFHMNKNHPDLEARARALPYQNNDKVSQDVLLEQAIQSLGVPSDMILEAGLLPDEPLELLETENFSTVNLRDLD